MTDNTLTNGDVIRCALVSNAPCLTGSGWAFSKRYHYEYRDQRYSTISVVATGNNVCAGNICYTQLHHYKWRAGASLSMEKEWSECWERIVLSYTDITLNNGDIVSCVLTSNSVCATVPTATSNGVTMIINPIAPPSIAITTSLNTICCRHIHYFFISHQ